MDDDTPMGDIVLQTMRWCRKRELEKTMDNEHCDPFAWELVTVTKEPEWTVDESGVYVVIHRLHWDGMARHVRLDLMRDNGVGGCATEPIRSWQGTAEAVRKSVMRWLDKKCPVSLEHASYIGSELARASLRVDYVQS